MALGVGLFGTSASGQLWWENPALRSKTHILWPPDAIQYWNMDEDYENLFVFPAYASGTPAALFKTADLIAASTATNTAAIVRPSATANGYTSFKGAALSKELGRALVFNSGSTRQYTSGPLTSPWTRSNTVFVVTNNANIYADAGDFDYLGEYLYVNCSSPSARRNTIWKFAVGNLEAHGSNASPNLTSNKVITTSNSRVRNLSLYNIDGKDLIYYGSGTGTTTSGGMVWVYDTSTDTETQLINQGDGVPYGVDTWHDIMNVKVSGIGTTQMWLYVTGQGFDKYPVATGLTTCDFQAGISIFPLAADGKSVGAMVKHLTYSNMVPVIGAVNYRMDFAHEWRGFEVSADGKYAFIGNNLNPPNVAFVYVLHTPPPMGTTFLVR